MFQVLSCFITVSGTLALQLHLRVSEWELPSLLSVNPLFLFSFLTSRTAQFVVCEPTFLIFFSSFLELPRPATCWLPWLVWSSQLVPDSGGGQTSRPYWLHNRKWIMRTQSLSIRFLYELVLPANSGPEFSSSEYLCSSFPCWDHCMSVRLFCCFVAFWGSDPSCVSYNWKNVEPGLVLILLRCCWSSPYIETRNKSCVSLKTAVKLTVKYCTFKVRILHAKYNDIMVQYF